MTIAASSASQVGLARQRRVQRGKRPGRIEQHPRRLAAAREVEGDLGAQQLEAGTSAGRPAVRPRRSSAAPGRPRTHRPRAWPAAASSARLGTDGRLRGQLDRLLQERGRGGQTAAGARPSGRALQLGGGLLVGAQHRPRAVPGAPVRVGLWVGGGGQRAVHAATVRLRAAPGRRPSAPAGGGTAPGCRSPAARPLRRARPPRARSPGVSAARHSSGCVAGRVGRREQQQQLGLGRQVPRALPEDLLDAARHAQRVGQLEAAGQLVRAGALRGSSSSARGLPRASATIRSRTSSSSGVRTAAASSARASLSPRPSRRSSGSPA